MAQARRRVPPPGYTARRPQYPAVRALKRTSGTQDTLVNLTELSLRYFEGCFEATSPSDFVKREADRLRVNTSLGVSWEAVRANFHLTCVVQVMTVLEAFVVQLGGEMRAYKRMQGWKRKNGEGVQVDALTALTLNMSDDAAECARKCPEFDLLQYCWHVRNRVIHDGDDDLLAAEHAELIAAHGRHFEHCYGHKPNPRDRIAYADFLLLTRAIKYYSVVLNDSCELTAADIVRHHLKDAKFRANLRQRRTPPKRLHPLVNNLASTYVLDPNDTDEVGRLLRSWLDEEPTKRERKRQRNRH